MSLAWISLIALAVAVIVSCTTTINVGVLALSAALVVGVYLGQMPTEIVLEGFPVELFVTLVGVTLLFSIAETNGTLERLTAQALRVCRGRAAAIPFLFFALGFFLSTIGAGSVAGSALLAPAAMAAASRAGIAPFPMILMAGNGTLAGTLSPFAPTGIVANGVMERIDLGGMAWEVFAYNALAHAAVGLAGFLLFGGWQMIARPGPSIAAEARPGDMERRHWMTAGGIAVLIIGVVGLGHEVGTTALVVATVLILLRATEEQKASRGMPWAVILMVTGVSVLVTLADRTEGLDLFTAGLTRISTPETVAPIVAFGAGLVSVYSSTSGVVLPAFLPMVPELATGIGGVEPVALALSMNVGASLVDLSSLSTTGALFLAATGVNANTRQLFGMLLAWGLSMCLVGPAICWLLFG
ncbi:MAG TPA: SLC13 family permease [Gammaproteobacteria bacterium]|nr:SLC13 family permease [Gammaproteobacteria bacterium]